MPLPPPRSQTLPHTAHTPDPHTTTKCSPQSAEQHPQQSSRHGGAEGRQAAGKCHLLRFPHKEGGWWASNVCTRIAALPLSSFAGDVYGCACAVACVLLCVVVCVLLCMVVCVLLCLVVSGCAAIQGRGSAKDGGEFLKINRPYKCLVCELRFCVSLQVCLKDSRAPKLNILL